MGVTGAWRRIVGESLIESVDSPTPGSGSRPWLRVKMKALGARGF